MLRTQVLMKAQITIDADVSIPTINHMQRTTRLVLFQAYVYLPAFPHGTNSLLYVAVC